MKKRENHIKKNTLISIEKRKCKSSTLHNYAIRDRGYLIWYWWGRGRFTLRLSDTLPPWGGHLQSSLQVPSARIIWRENPQFVQSKPISWLCSQYIVIPSSHLAECSIPHYAPSRLLSKLYKFTTGNLVSKHKWRDICVSTFAILITTSECWHVVLIKCPGIF